MVDVDGILVGIGRRKSRCSLSITQKRLFHECIVREHQGSSKDSEELAAEQQKGFHCQNEENAEILSDDTRPERAKPRVTSCAPR